MSKFQRKNNRDYNQFRQFSVELGVLNRADGSVKYSQGDSCVLVAVYGPCEVRPSKELPDKATVEVVFKPREGLPGPLEKEYEHILTSTFEQIISRELFPRTLINIVIQVVVSDGSILSTALNGAMLAFMDAGIALKTIISSVTCGIICDSKEVLLIDPDAHEEKICNTAYFVFDSNDMDGIISTRTKGVFSDAAYWKCLTTARFASKYVTSFIRQSMAKKVTFDETFMKPISE